VYILISKDDTKVRVQSPEFPFIWFVVQGLIKRLMDLYSNGKGASGDDFSLSYPDAIPLNELF
jgi:PTHB1 C-terminus